MNTPKYKNVGEAMANLLLIGGASVGIGFGSGSFGYAVATFCFLTLWCGFEIQKARKNH